MVCSFFDSTLGSLMRCSPKAVLLVSLASSDKSSVGIGLSKDIRSSLMVFSVSREKVFGRFAVSSETIIDRSGMGELIYPGKLTIIEHLGTESKTKGLKPLIY